MRKKTLFRYSYFSHTHRHVYKTLHQLQYRTLTTLSRWRKQNFLKRRTFSDQKFYNCNKTDYLYQNTNPMTPQRATSQGFDIKAVEKQKGIVTFLFVNSLREVLSGSPLLILVCNYYFVWMWMQR